MGQVKAWCGSMAEEETGGKYDIQKMNHKNYYIKPRNRVLNFNLS